MDERFPRSPQCGGQSLQRQLEDKGPGEEAKSQGMAAEVETPETVEFLKSSLGEMEEQLQAVREQCSSQLEAIAAFLEADQRTSVRCVHSLYVMMSVFSFTCAELGCTGSPTSLHSLLYSVAFAAWQS